MMFCIDEEYVCGTFIDNLNKKLDTIMNKINELEVKVETIWYAPNGPAFQEAKKDFEHLSN